MISKITKAYFRIYTDNSDGTMESAIAYVEWIDKKGAGGRTEGKLDNLHMQALIKRAKREGITVECQQW